MPPRRGYVQRVSQVLSTSFTVPPKNMLDADYFREVYKTVLPVVEGKYGLHVVVDVIPAPFTGDIDGASIFIDSRLDAEESLFLLLHLFGHSVQWNSDAAARALGLLAVRSPSEELLGELAAYENTAGRYALHLLNDVGVRDLDQWLANFAACDVAYLMDFYRTGEKRPFQSFWNANATRLIPLAIPAFRPQRWVSRRGVVI